MEQAENKEQITLKKTVRLARRFTNFMIIIVIESLIMKEINHSNDNNQFFVCIEVAATSKSSKFTERTNSRSHCI